MTSVLYSEIFEQPAAIARVLTESLPEVRTLVSAIKSADIRYVALAARGTSDNAAIYAKYLLQILCGIPVMLTAPSVHTLYGGTVNYKNALVIGVSQSGAGEDICEVVSAARKAGALTAAITNTEGSKLAQTAEHLLPCRAGQEYAVAATKTYTTTLAIFALIAAEWSENADFTSGLKHIPEVAESALSVAEPTIPALAKTLFHAEKMLTVARGPHFATAIEASLKIAETSGTTTQAFSSADLLHGPIASVAGRTPCLLFAPAGKSAEGMTELATKLAERNARVIHLSPEIGADIPLVSPSDELLSPIVDILPAQLLAYYLTLARGLDPDNPRGLSKVTITR
ncbi:MAG: SIS domain-containing protein [Fibrella sp.]|nr:SIS domain-containing protein [Armatimonadota bacterium]